MGSVICRVCGKEFQRISNTHLKLHSITMVGYKEMFPDASMITENLRTRYSSKNQR